MQIWFSLLLGLVLLLLPPSAAFSFGFHAHRIINRMAVFTLPPEMVGFYKIHVEYLAERSIDPDRRAHAVVGEAQRHYIDIDHFGYRPFDIMPKHWEDAVEKFTEDTLQEQGVLPWHIHVMAGRLTRSFRDRDVDRILYHSAHLGHYIADACTPLHTTKHYNGRVPAERGIHALWESRLPELLSGGFSYFVGRAEYIDCTLDKAWKLIEHSHLKVDTVYAVYDSLMTVYSPDRLYTHEMRGQSTVRAFSRDFSAAYEVGMNHMVERQMQAAIKAVGDFWYTAWVDAGQPDLYALEGRAISQRHRRRLEEERKEWEQVAEPVGRANPD